MNKRILLFLQKFVLLACTFLLSFGLVNAQKYTFTHYDIENGLIQSQVNRISQDNTHRLWMATLGGAARFDGMEHFALSKANGLKNNFIYAVFCDREGTTWIGASKGLAYYKNDQVHNIITPNSLRSGWINHLTQDASGTIWGIIENHLFKVMGNRMVLVNPTGGKHDTVSTVAVNKQGKLFVALNYRSIYSLDGESWKNYFTLPIAVSSLSVVKLMFDRQQTDRLFIQAYGGIFVVEGGKIAPYKFDLLKTAIRPFVSMEQDADNNIWIGTAKGAYRVAQGKLTYFNAQNGFSDAQVSEIYRDNDNNIWLGTQGDGLYRYNNDGYISYNQYDGNSAGPIVMGIAVDKQQNALLAIDGGGVAKYDGKTINSIWRETDGSYARSVLSLYNDSTGLMWVGANGNGIWHYDGKKFKIVEGTERLSGLIFKDGDNGLVWAGTSAGVFYFDKDHRMYPTGVNVFTSSLITLGKDSVLLGTHEGVKLLVNKKAAPGFNLKELGNTAIYCMIRYKNLALIGTDDQGVFVWDRQTHKVRNYTTKAGLSANSIYALAVDEYGTIWAGTGRGVSRFTIDSRGLNFNIIPGSDAKDRIIESNQNAILYSNHQMLVGTTKGLSVYSTALPGKDATIPYVMIDDVKLFTNDEAEPKTLTIGDKPIQLSANQNHLSITFLGVYLKSPAQVTYQYRLVGLSNQFCMPAKNNMVDYPSLPPGKYTFEVRAIVGDKQVSTNKASFSFEITPPFYQTIWFKFGVILLLVLIGVLIQRDLHRRKLNRMQAIEAMRQDEKMKIRQQTAEDFHDDLGNKLTRITVLSDILNAKLDHDKAEHRKLVGQIKQNAASLYNGTRDILWAMDPKSDNLYEVLNHIRETGIEIFADTEVDFKFDGIMMEQAVVKLPMEYSRNITMIFKEILNNALKYAHAGKVKIELTRYDNEGVTIQIADDGVGFDTSLPSRGHGLVNIQSRAKRIGGNLVVTSSPGAGTTVILSFNINNKQGKA